MKQSKFVLLLLLMLFAVAIQANATGIIPAIGTINTGGASVVSFGADVVTLLEFLADAALALTIVAVLIAVGWKVYRFFKPAR